MRDVGKPDVIKSTSYLLFSYNSYKFLSKSYTRAIL
jgi:hypothetical protein